MSCRDGERLPLDRVELILARKPSQWVRCGALARLYREEGFGGLGVEVGTKPIWIHGVTRFRERRQVYPSARFRSEPWEEG